MNLSLSILKFKKNYNKHINQSKIKIKYTNSIEFNVEITNTYNIYQNIILKYHI
ncbi:hypothetical protein EBI_27104 [Enterocytozoon bieneusi H348]|nr:hypothetical protein EBI_27104 [Enterocytozoon bieneusi H348]|eukprot:XP_002649790.1 hypothetical protein EBI_27104 [Enterocytozoon bieneusi H348]